MTVVSCAVDDATLRALDDIAKDMRLETGQLVTRSDMLREAIREFVTDYNKARN